MYMYSDLAWVRALDKADAMIAECWRFQALWEPFTILFLTAVARLP